MGLLDQLKQIIDPKVIINWGGYPALMAVIFAETGLLVGFFLPGDSLLVTAGVFVQADLLNPFQLPPFVNLLLLNAVLIICAIVGDAVGFAFGRKAGPALFNREQSRFFRKDYLLSTQSFYEKHGGKTIVLARFMPFARTFAPIVAGIGQMPYRKFVFWNVLGGFLWVTSMTFLGYFLGKIFDAKQIEKVVMLVIVVSVAPLFIGWANMKLKARKARKAEEAAAKTS
jgi:membrane-associated protein